MPLDSLTTYIASLAALGDRAAVIERTPTRTQVFSYAETIGRAHALAAALAARAVKPGDRVLLWGESGMAWVAAFYGCMFAGAVAVPLDAAFSPDYVRRVHQHTTAMLLLADAERAASVGEIPALHFEEIRLMPVLYGPRHVMAAAPEALLEIVYTSGTTAEPKGVMITHGNLLANLRPIEAEVRKYERWASPLLPLRFVHLIPLSHLFGQSLGLFIPTLIRSAVVYPSSQNPSFIAETIKSVRASAAVVVPQQLEMLSGWALETLTKLERRAAPLTARDVLERSRGHHYLVRWWIWRRLHRRLGWKMWAFIVGGAALAPEQEELWSALGYAVIQGYGLTETAPAIAISHPFRLKRGAVGRKLAGMEVKIAENGEILVRGPNVSPGYYRNPEATRETFGDQWLHTGDLGRLDEEGNLVYLGRLKEIIVTSEGLNVYPQDVEKRLEEQPEIVEAAVVAEEAGGRPRVHAVIVPRRPADEDARRQIEAAVGRANERLEAHQRVRGISIWPDASLPRTPSTRKLQRVKIASWVNHRAGAPSKTFTAEPANWRQFAAARFGIPLERLTPEARLPELGLSSLDRVELLSWLEARGIELNESELASAETVADVNRLIEGTTAEPGGAQAAPAEGAGTGSVQPPETEGGERGAGPPRAAVRFSYPHWPTARPVRALRTALLYTIALPALRTVARMKVENAEVLRTVRPPVLFVSNHQSLLDVALIVRALPPRWRTRLAAAMGADWFRELFAPGTPPARRWRSRLRFGLTELFFNTYFLSDRTGVQNALRHTGELADRGFSPLIFPEGARTRTGRLLPFRGGIGVFIRELRLPVVPVILRGAFEILPTGAEHARRGEATVTFGRPLMFEGEDPNRITAMLQRWYEERLGPVESGQPGIH
jgi:long-chain acyl-CoA synthetase